jgi:hypothetical protein
MPCDALSFYQVKMSHTLSLYSTSSNTHESLNYFFDTYYNSTYISQMSTIFLVSFDLQRPHVVTTTWYYLLSYCNISNLFQNDFHLLFSPNYHLISYFLTHQKAMCKNLHITIPNTWNKKHVKSHVEERKGSRVLKELMGLMWSPLLNGDLYDAQSL